MSKSHEQTRMQVERSLRRRYRAERRFRLYGLGAVLLGMAAVVVLFGSIFGRGLSAFRQAEIALDIHYDPAEIDPAGGRLHRLALGRDRTLEMGKRLIVI